MAIEVVPAQVGAVAHGQLGIFVLLQLLRQFLQADGPIRAQAGQLAALTAEQGVINLAAPGVHGTDDGTLKQPPVLGHGLQGGHAAAGLILCPGQALQSRNADAQACKAARPCRHG